MQVGYGGKPLVSNYSCVRGNQLHGTERCQSVGGRRIERVVLDAVFQPLAPAGIDATLRAIEHAGSDHRARVTVACMHLRGQCGVSMVAVYLRDILVTRRAVLASQGLEQ